MQLQKEIEILKSILDQIMKEEGTLNKIISEVLNTLRNGGTILTCGNGGSAADAEHLAAELVGRFQKERNSLPAISLCSGSSLMTCLGNDYGFDNLFARQIQGLGKAGDILICFTTSGNSKNVIEGIQAAKMKRMKTISFLGKDGGKTKNLADYQIIVPSNSTPRIQEIHTLLLHQIAQAIDDDFN